MSQINHREYTVTLVYDDDTYGYQIADIGLTPEAAESLGLELCPRYESPDCVITHEIND